jgi:hypothetical protein
MSIETFIATFRKSGVLAFCPRCGALKAEYRKPCKSCGLNPRSEDSDLARAILMSTEQYYMRSNDWEARTPVENAHVIETEIIPNLIEKASILSDRREVVFNPEEESYWTQRIRAEKQRKPPKSFGCFLVTLYVIIGVVVILFIMLVLLK